jgi:hypothetical protein
MKMDCFFIKSLEGGCEMANLQIKNIDDGFYQMKTSAQLLLDLSGSWDEEIEADEIVLRIKRKRSNSNLSAEIQLKYSGC